MIPYAVLSSESLNLPSSLKDCYRTNYQLPPSIHGITLRRTNEVPIKQAIINIITLPDLRGALIFKFKKEQSDLTIFEPRTPLKKEEIRGGIVYAIQRLRKGETFFTERVRLNARSYMQKPREIVSTLERIAPEEKVFIILLFKEFIFISGNYFDETILCRGLLEFRQQKRQEVIRIMREPKDRLSFLMSEKDRNYKFPVFFNYKKVL